MTQHTLRLLILCFLALLLRSLWALAIYEPSLVLYHGGDYTLYRIGAEHIAARGLDFSNSLFLVRPPLFSLMILATGLQDLLVLALNILLGTGLVPLSYILARRLGSSPALALGTALIVALDPASIVSSAQLLAEPLANVLLLLSIIALVIAAQVPQRSWAWALLAGLLLGLSAAARPAPYLLWLPLGLWLAWQLRRIDLRWLGYVTLSGLLVGAWILHNALVFGNASYSTIGTYNLLYYRAVSVEYQATGQPLEAVYTELSRRVEDRLGRDSSGVDAGTRHSHYASTADVQDAMTETAIEVFLAHPLIYIATIPVGLARIFLDTPLLPTALRILEIPWNMIFLLGSLLGLFHAFRQRNWALLSIVLLVCAYFTAGTLLVQTSGIGTRARTPFTPFMAIVFAQAFAYVILPRLQALRADSSNI